MRIRYRDDVGPWFSWLFVSRAEMKMLLRGTGWHQSRILGGGPSEPYVAVLEKDGSRPRRDGSTVTEGV